MARGLPKPWKKHRPNGKVEWYVTVNQKQVFLAEDGVNDEELQQKLLLTLSEHLIYKPGFDVRFLAVMKHYLDHVKAHQSPKSYRIRSQALQSFRKFLETVGHGTIACKDLIPFHVYQWLDWQQTWGPNTQRMAIISLKVCLNWAYKQGILKERILEHLETPQVIYRGQEVVLTQEQRELLIDNCHCECQKDLLTALYSSGCRPGELCRLRTEDVRFDTIPPIWIVRGKRTRHQPDGVRYIALSSKLVELTRKLLAQHPTGLLFRNRAGTAWHSGLIDAFVYRLRRRLIKRGHKLPPKVIPYGYRHTFATDLLEGGAHDYDVAKLMGHSGTKMVHQVYSKHSVATASRALAYLKESSLGDSRNPELSGEASLSQVDMDKIVKEAVQSALAAFGLGAG